VEVELATLTSRQWDCVVVGGGHNGLAADVVEYRQVLGPPDVETRIALTGGHIFQGECLPDQMWDRRLPPRTPMAGVYLCGAATHPGGGVSAVNGRNAAMAVLADLRRVSS